MADSGPIFVDFAISGPIVQADFPGLCDRACALLAESGAGMARCDVRGVEPDAVTVDALARLQLAARRVGLEIRVCNASAELRSLVELVGLTEVLRVEPGREPEEREDRLGAEEERELDDPPA